MRVTPAGMRDAAHDQSTDNPPKQDFVLVVGGSFEVAEDGEEDGQIVDAERGSSMTYPVISSREEAAAVPEVER